jgi:hypothetical protein
MGRLLWFQGIGPRCGVGIALDDDPGARQVNAPEHSLAVRVGVNPRVAKVAEDDQVIFRLTAEALIGQMMDV